MADDPAPPSSKPSVDAEPNESKVPGSVPEDEFEPFEPNKPLLPAGTDAVVRAVDWRGALPFTHIFQGFRIAKQGSMILLALVAVLLLYLTGQALDAAWRVVPWTERPVAGSVELYAATVLLPEAPDYHQAVATERERLEQNVERRRATLAAARDVDPAGIDLGDIKDDILAERAAAIAAARELGEDADAAAAVRSAYENASEEWAQVRAVEGVGPFMAFLEFETNQLNAAVVALLLDWSVWGALSALGAMLLIGPAWAITQYPVFFLLYFLISLAILAICGGAMTRIAAIGFARDETVGFREALRFSSGKFVSFVTAPLIPLLLLGALGLLVAAGGAIMNLWAPGTVVVAAGFFLILLAALVMTLLVVGLLGGVSLMFPVIAVESTDSFDAMSRSFTYLYGQPWRLLFYKLVALVYGAAVYGAVRLFAWLLLLLAHAFAGLLVFRTLDGDRPVLGSIWTDTLPPGSLSYDVDYFALSPMNDLAASLLSFWIYLVVALVAAFAVSLYFTLSTIIYLLIRREVDATSLDDVYIEYDEAALMRELAVDELKASK
jgi:hypothetical protein